MARVVARLLMRSGPPTKEKMALLRWSTTSYSPDMTNAILTRDQPLAAAERSRIGDNILLLTPGLVWGPSFLFIAEGLRAVGPAGVAFGRLAVGVLTLLLVPAARRP